MRKVLTIKEAIVKSKELRNKRKRVVLAGGCFDILHLGHIQFIKESKKQGDVLFLLLESDDAIHKRKGPERPINTQHVRAQILEALKDVDFVVLLPALENDEYDDIICRIAPSVITTTQGDYQRFHKERQAKILKGKVVDVIPKIDNASTTKIAKLLSKDL